MLSTVKETVTGAVGTVTNATAAGLEKAIGVVETCDAESVERPKQFGAVEGQSEEAKELVADDAKSAEGDVVEKTASTELDQSLRRLKVVSGDLLDLWLYEGSKGLNYISQTKAYQVTDPYVNYLGLYEAMKVRGEKLAEKVGELNQKIVLFYDDATNFVGMLVKVLQERQDDLVKYITETYSNVQVFVKDNWMRLDFNQDGQVSMEDMRKNMNEFYEFLKSYDYIEATTRIKSSMYDNALKLMQKDQQSKKVADSAENNEVMVEDDLRDEQDQVSSANEVADEIENSQSESDNQKAQK